MGVQFYEIDQISDERGDAYFLQSKAKELLGDVAEMHFVTLQKDAVRGNHFHKEKKEIMFVIYDGKWTFAWEISGKIMSKSFEGKSSLLILIPENIVHAIRNDDENLLQVLSIANKPYTPKNPDTFVRQIFIVFGYRPKNMASRGQLKIDRPKIMRIKVQTSTKIVREPNTL